ncbi:Mbov_0396 family ICE element transmembrane protein [Candidatus Mycoplasma pogonae]
MIIIASISKIFNIFSLEILLKLIFGENLDFTKIIFFNNAGYLVLTILGIFLVLILFIFAWTRFMFNMNNENDPEKNTIKVYLKNLPIAIGLIIFIPFILFFGLMLTSSIFTFIKIAFLGSADITIDRIFWQALMPQHMTDNSSDWGLIADQGYVAHAGGVFGAVSKVFWTASPGQAVGTIITIFIAAVVLCFVLLKLVIMQAMALFHIVFTFIQAPIWAAFSVSDGGLKIKQWRVKMQQKILGYLLINLMFVAWASFSAMLTSANVESYFIEKLDGNVAEGGNAFERDVNNGFNSVGKYFTGVEPTTYMTILIMRVVLIVGTAAAFRSLIQEILSYFGSTETFSTMNADASQIASIATKMGSQGAMFASAGIGVLGGKALGIQANGIGDLVKFGGTKMANSLKNSSAAQKLKSTKVGGWASEKAGQYRNWRMENDKLQNPDKYKNQNGGKK